MILPEAEAVVGALLAPLEVDAFFAAVKPSGGASMPHFEADVPSGNTLNGAPPPATKSQSVSTACGGMRRNDNR